MTVHRQHVATVPGRPADLASRRSPRVIVYVEDAVEVLTDHADGALLDAGAARQLAAALLNAADVLDARIGDSPAGDR